MTITQQVRREVFLQDQPR
ncbi:hypothetical protein EC950183_2007, partial [Escherichia coli 95.0183]